MLTWDDTLKLCIPFIFSIALIWIHYHVARLLETKAKKESLWRIFSTKNLGLASDLKGLNTIIDAYRAGEYASFTYALDDLPKNIAVRLSELTPKQTFIYERYISSYSAVQRNMKSLQSVIHCLITTTEISDGRVRNAIQSQVEVLKSNLIELCEAQIFVMEHFSKERNTTFDPQTVVQERNMIASLKPHA
ncbi:hypothetical protein KC131_14770 [Pseudomonas sp. JQ170]|uniref:hypothetical protein n=1 Tax=unclassified Pseudomonas TaxID=196821 RepID=UPI00264BAB2C|nr:MULTISPECIES: hypothetical protein [unclassified Pseudomonas]MDN7141909.1 hypothetical protein [Pseudomonas sp. JQ170]WRO78209.1 hypothetical protein U9R80_11230 [Pseudomonas sp. 170C]